MLALLALLGFAAIAKGTNIFGPDGVANAQLAVPRFFDQVFPDWFAGVCFAAIAIGALVPAAIMSIAAANLFTRNIYREFVKHDASPKHEAQVSKLVSLVVKFGALLFVLGLDAQNAINFQLLGGVWILQTIIAIVAGLYTRWFHRWALLAGWAVGMVYGTVVAYQQQVPEPARQARQRARRSSAAARDTSARRWRLPVHGSEGVHRDHGPVAERRRRRGGDGVTARGAGTGRDRRHQTGRLLR